MILTIAIPLFFVAVAALAGMVVADSLGRGLAAGRAILRELSALEAGRYPAPPVRITLYAARRQPARHPAGTVVARPSARNSAVSRPSFVPLRAAA